MTFDIAEQTERFISDFVQLREQLSSDAEVGAGSDELFRLLGEQIVPDVLRRLQRTGGNTEAAV